MAKGTWGPLPEKDDPIFSEGVQIHFSPQSTPSTDEAPPHELTPPSAPETAPLLSPAPRLWHRYCNRTRHIPDISDVPTSLPPPESDD